MAAIARVEPLTTARAVRGPFDYRLPEEWAGVREGSLLVVPFGRRRVLGVVLELAEHTDVAPERLAEPLRALELGVPPELVRLALWVAAAYCSTPARALALVLPPGTGSGTDPRVGERTGLVAELTEEGTAAIGRVAGAGGSLLSERQRSVLVRLAGGPLRATATGADHGALRRLERRGLIALERRVLARRPVHVAVGARRAQPAKLTPAQGAALSDVEAALARPEAPAAQRRFLLHGVTGSGKTEVYLRAAAAALAAGRGAIVLVPEIALTPQTVGRFVERFGDTVAVLHSRLKAGERHDEWLRLRRGEARVCVGPRSAVFAPVADLGLLVVDEEHESAYKHEGDPRYDARAVAERRADAAGAVLVAGSATPRPESRHRLARLRLPERVDGRALPPVEIVDMRGAAHALHPVAREALVEVRRRGEKAIVLLNRRGWSNFLSCRSCGQAWECPQCDVALVLHRAQHRLACHHCGHHEPVPTRCASCGSISVARHGAGTERLEHELAAALEAPGFPVLRLDADVSAGRSSEPSVPARFDAAAAPDRGRPSAAAVLAGFDAAPAGVLLGTQMVAKGHDFPDVTLGVVLDADRTLRFPDFRAEERTFALLTQLAGRAGRGPRGGRVLVQTLDPDAPAIRLAATHDADGFLDAELARREALRYPPFGRLIRVVCGSPTPGAALVAAGAVRDRLDPPGALVLGPAPLFRLRGRERAQVVVKASDAAAAASAVGAAVEAVARTPTGRRATFSVDVDPQ
ncbi:MAG: replication restart helicase PriA [Solirubrobacteraceae bacterium]